MMQYTFSFFFSHIHICHTKLGTGYQAGHRIPRLDSLQAPGDTRSNKSEEQEKEHSLAPMETCTWLPSRREKRASGRGQVHVETGTKKPRGGVEEMIANHVLEASDKTATEQGTERKMRRHGCYEENKFTF